MFDPNYRRGTWTVLIMTVFNQWTGIDALNIYSNRLLTKMNENQVEGQLMVSANTATIMFGLTNFLGSIAAFFTVHNFGRVKILIWARLVMGLLHLSFAICVLYE